MAPPRRAGPQRAGAGPRSNPTPPPGSAPTFLVDGQVAGTWKYEGGKIALQPFEPLPRAVRRELEDEAIGLAALHA